MRAKVIDCHAHFGNCVSTHVECADARSMLRVMDRVGVDALSISSLLAIGPDCRAGNDLVGKAVREHPDRFIGYAVANPNRPTEIDPELSRCIEQLGLRAIKIHPAWHEYSIQGSGYVPVFEFAARNRLPILSHEWGPPEFLDKLSSDYPEVNFIMAHTGFWDGRSDFTYGTVLRDRPNVFVDLVYSNIFYEVLERLVDQVGADKILWGSDFPMHDLAYQIGRVSFSKLDETSKQKVLGANMQRILGD